MKQDIAVLGGVIGSSICFYASWRLCEASTGSWGWFAFVGFISLFLSCLTALAPNGK